MDVFDVLFRRLLQVDLPEATSVDQIVGPGEQLRRHQFVQIAVIRHQLIIISSNLIPHFPSPLFSIPLRPRLNCLSSSSVIFFPSLIPFLLFSSCSISLQYYAALPMPINLRNLIRSSFDFLLIVISLSILRVDSLSLKGKVVAFFSFDLDRERDSSELSLLFSTSLLDLEGAFETPAVD